MLCHNTAVYKETDTCANFLVYMALDFCSQTTLWGFTAPLMSAEWPRKAWPGVSASLTGAFVTAVPPSRITLPHRSAAHQFVVCFWVWKESLHLAEVRAPLWAWARNMVLPHVWQSSAQRAVVAGRSGDADSSFVVDRHAKVASPCVPGTKPHRGLID